ncbi:MAG: MarP family serine protease [Candidatus Limnocylindria bacterium]
MNLLDLAVLLLLVVGIVSGARAGFLGPVLGLAGAAIGFGIGLVMATLFREQLAQIEQPMPAIVTLVGLATFVLVGEAAGAAAGATMSLGLHRSGLRPIDAVGGGVVGAAHVALLVWIVSGMLAVGMAPSIGAAARESITVRLVTDRLPPPTIIAGRLLTLLDSTDVPQLFGGLEPPPAAPVDLPADAEAAALAQSALASTARISSSGCGNGLAVGSGFFVSPTAIMTNAHVVAGATETTITVGGSVHAATVVAFDPEADLALLNAPSASGPPLRLLATAPLRGSTGVALGYPGGGDLTVTPAAVTASYRIAGPSIYGEGAGERSVVEMTTQIRRGNSGGPLVVEPGVVGGVVFGASRVSADVGYAIGSDQALERIGPSIGSTAPVGTGACL